MAPRNNNNNNDGEDLLLTLTLSHISQTAFKKHLHPPPPPPPPPQTAVRQRRSVKRTPRTPKEGKSETVPPPYPWAADRRATVLSLDDLRSSSIKTVRGEVQCRRCERRYEMEYEVEQKFGELANYVINHMAELKQRAPLHWKSPVFPTCEYCKQENSARPVIGTCKREINWLFLFLGQLLGCCTLDQLRYFCKHTNNHRTGAKDRVLYLTYLTLCKQLDPTGPFDL